MENETVFDVDFTPEFAARIARMHSGELNPERYTRARTQIDFMDLVAEFEGTHSHTLSCPFHGRDSRPSFVIYPASNAAHCFGCPSGQQDYDNVNFVAAKLGGSKVEALKWLEKHYDLPPMDDVYSEVEEEEEEVLTLTFADLSEAFIQYASKAVQAQRDAEYAEELIRIYFEAERADDAVALAKLLGRDAVARILHYKR